MVRSRATSGIQTSDEFEHIGNRISVYTNDSSELANIRSSVQCTSLPRLSSVFFNMFDRLHKPKYRNFNKYYCFEENIGRGSSSYVHICSSLESGKRYAVKHIVTYDKTAKEKSMVEKEIEISTSMNHPGICAVVDVFRSPVSIHIVQELALGGDLLSHLEDKKSFNEEVVSEIVTSILKALVHLHSNGIVHRDIKLENIVCMRENSDVDVKIVDFGFATYVSNITNNRKVCGTPNYVAPEMIRGDVYNEKVDIWSLGVLSYTLLCGYFPFCGRTTEELFQSIAEGSYSFHYKNWKNVSLGARNFIKHMLQPDPNFRWSAEKLLEHPFISGTTNIPENGSNIPSLCTQSFRRCNTESSIGRNSSIQHHDSTCRLLAGEKKGVNALVFNESQSIVEPTGKQQKLLTKLKRRSTCPAAPARSKFCLISRFLNRRSNSKRRNVISA